MQKQLKFNNQKFPYKERKHVRWETACSSTQHATQNSVRIVSCRVSSCLWETSCKILWQITNNLLPIPRGVGMVGKRSPLTPCLFTAAYGPSPLLTVHLLRWFVDSSFFVLVFHPLFTRRRSYYSLLLLNRPFTMHCGQVREPERKKVGDRITFPQYVWNSRAPALWLIVSRVQVGWKRWP